MFCRTEDGSLNPVSKRKSPFAARTDNMEHYNSKGEIVRPKLCLKPGDTDLLRYQRTMRNVRVMPVGRVKVRLKSRILDLRDEVQEGGEIRRPSGAYYRGKRLSATRPSPRRGTGVVARGHGARRQTMSDGHVAAMRSPWNRLHIVVAQTSSSAQRPLKRRGAPTVSLAISK